MQSYSFVLLVVQLMYVLASYRSHFGVALLWAVIL